MSRRQEAARPHDLDAQGLTGREDVDGDEGAAPPSWARQRVPALVAGPRRALFATLVACLLGQAALVVVAALVARRALDAATRAGADAQVVLAWFAAMTAALIAIAMLRWCKVVLGERLAQDHIREVRLALFDTLATLSAARRQRRSRGAVMLRFMGDAQALRDWAAQGAPNLVAAVLAGAALLAGLALLAAELAALAAAWFAVAGVGMAMTLPPLARRVREARLRLACLAANVHDRIAAVAVMQSAAQAPRERGRLARQIDRLTEATVQRARAQAHHRWWLDLALAGLALSVLVLWSLGAAARGDWSGAFDGVGVLVGALGLIGLLAAPLRRVGRALEQRVAAEVARDRIADFLADAEPAPPPTSAPLPHEPLLRLAGVPLPQRPQHPLAAQVAAGRCIALVGPPGSGKTALLETLARLRPLTAGEIELGDRPLGALGLREFGERVSHVSADTPVQRGTVARNLRYRRRLDSEEDLRAAAEAAGWPGPLDEAALSLRVRDGGSNLGGSQRRALLLASALAGRPALLLADDLEHLLDSADLEAAFRRLRRTHRGTLIFSTHDPRLAALADDRWVLGEPAPAQPSSALRLVTAGGP